MKLGIVALAACLIVVLGGSAVYAQTGGAGTAAAAAEQAPGTTTAPGTMPAPSGVQAPSPATPTTATSPQAVNPSGATTTPGTAAPLNQSPTGGINSPPAGTPGAGTPGAATSPAPVGTAPISPGTAVNPGAGGARSIVPLTGATGAAAPETSGSVPLEFQQGSPPPLPGYAINTGVPDLSGLPARKQSGSLTAATPYTATVSWGGHWKKMQSFLLTPEARADALNIKPGKDVTVHYRTVHYPDVGDVNYATSIER